MGAADGFIVARELAVPGTYLAPLPTATVLLKSTAAPRNASLCQGWAGLETTGAVTSGSATAQPIVPLRWMLKNDPETAPKVCADLLAQYDFPRSESLLEQLGALPNAPDLSGPGPFIVQWMPDGSAIIFDGSTRSVAALRQMPSQFVVQTGAIVSADVSMTACVEAAVATQGGVGDRTVAFLKCQFPEGVTPQLVKDATCSLARFAGSALPGGQWTQSGLKMLCG